MVPENYEWFRSDAVYKVKQHGHPHDYDYNDVKPTEGRFPAGRTLHFPQSQDHSAVMAIPDHLDFTHSIPSAVSARRKTR